MSWRLQLRWMQIEVYHCMGHGALLGTHVLLAFGSVLWVYMVFSVGNLELCLWLTLFFLALHTGTLWSAYTKGAALYAYMHATPACIWRARFVIHTLWLLSLSGLVVALYVGWLNYAISWHQLSIIALALLNAACIMSFIGTLLTHNSPNTHKLITLFALPMLLPIWMICFHLSTPSNPEQSLVQLIIPIGFFVALYSACSLLFPYIWNK